MGQQGRAVLFLLPSERGYVDKLQQHGVQVQQGNLMQHISHLHSPADRTTAQVGFSCCFLSFQSMRLLLRFR